MLRYYLEMEPQLFQAAVDEKFGKLQAARDAEAKAQQESASAALDLVLSRRMNEVKAKETRELVEDLMYLSVLEKFVALQVSMLPRLDGVVDLPQTNLRALTEGIHSKEALAMVKDHIMAMMGPTADAFSNSVVKMSKLQMTQVYAASIMFGYFLRRVDQRFQLEKAFGTLQDQQAAGTDDSITTDEEAIQRLERLFNSADSSTVEDEDTAEPDTDGTVYKSVQRQASLKEYAESFDQATLLETAQILSLEAAALVERQSTALFGDAKELQAQMSEVVGDDASSMEDLMQRVEEAVKEEKVATLTMSVGTQRRAVLEAVAYGTFLRDIENNVSAQYSLLTPAPTQPGPGLLDGE